MSSPEQVIVSGGFDDIRSATCAFWKKRRRLGELTVLSVDG